VCVSVCVCHATSVTKPHMRRQRTKASHQAQVRIQDTSPTGTSCTVKTNTFSAVSRISQELLQVKWLRPPKHPCETFLVAPCPTLPYQQIVFKNAELFHFNHAMLNYEAALSAYLLMSHALPLGQEFLALRPSQIRETFGPENQAKTRCSA